MFHVRFDKYLDLLMNSGDCRTYYTTFTKLSFIKLVNISKSVTISKAMRQLYQSKQKTNKNYEKRLSFYEAN